MTFYSEHLETCKVTCYILSFWRVCIKMSGSASSLWMGDLEPYMDEVFLMQVFQKMGEPMIGAKLIKNKTTGAPQGYCFIEFGAEAAAKTAMFRLNGKIIPDTQPAKRFKLNHASYGKEHLLLPEYSIFVGELTDDVDDLTLYQAFVRRFPSCRAAKVVTDHTGKSKNYGFVRFTSEEDQQRAIVEMQNSHGVGQKAIRVSVATPKSRSNVYTTTKSYNQGYAWQYNYDNLNQTGYNYGANTGYPYSYGGTGGQYQEYWDTSAYKQSEETAAKSASSEEEEEVEDPLAPINVDKENEKYMAESEELYEAMDNSRWHPLDNIMSEIKASPS